MNAVEFEIFIFISWFESAWRVFLIAKIIQRINSRVVINYSFIDLSEIFVSKCFQCFVLNNYIEIWWDSGEFVLIFTFHFAHKSLKENDVCMYCSASIIRMRNENKT